MSVPLETQQQEEATFRSFTAANASNYSAFRLDYHPTLYNAVLERHTSTGGRLDTLLDVGCGPGTAARALSGRFSHVTGVDPSAGMISQARELGGTSRSGEAIRFEVSSAEGLECIEDGSVDLMVVATAAHWFDMARFWVRAEQVLRPGGSVALWTHQGFGFDDSVPNADAIRAAIRDINAREDLDSHEKIGGKLSFGLYVELPLPWSTQGVDSFDEGSFYRVEFGTKTPGAYGADQLFAVGQVEVDLDAYEANMGTTSTVTRWREANPDKVGTERDVIRMHRRAIERLLHEAGVQPGQERIKRAEAGVLLVIKKKAES